MALTVIKASGQHEAFDLEKLSESLIRSGAPPELAEEIAREVRTKVTPLMKTKEIYRLARRLLKKRHRPASMRYAIKKAIFALGPSGYPFEKYVGRILSAYGYEVAVGRVVEGYCVSHEVDVVAKKDDEHCMIECKYHNRGGIATDVKVALYVHSRFQDIRKACEGSPSHGNALHRGWLVTNTRCTSEAIRYGECSDLKIVRWRYPDHESLEKLIGEKRLWPVSVLPSVRKASLDRLLMRDMILAQDIASMERRAFIRESGIDEKTASALKREADELCPCR